MVCPEKFLKKRICHCTDGNFTSLLWQESYEEWDLEHCFWLFGSILFKFYIFIFSFTCCWLQNVTARMITVRILGCPIRIKTVLTKVVCQRVIKGGQSSDVCILSNQRKWLSMATFTGSKRLNVYLLKCSTTRQSPVYLISSSTEEYGDFDSILEKVHFTSNDGEFWIFLTFNWFG